MKMQWVYIDMILKNKDYYKSIPVAPLLTLVTTILFLAHDVQRKSVVKDGYDEDIDCVFGMNASCDILTLDHHT